MNQIEEQTKYIPSGLISIPSDNRDRPKHNRSAFRVGSKGLGFL